MKWIVFFLQVISVVAESPGDVEAILRKYFSNDIYNSMVRGKIDLTRTTVVDMNFSLISIDTFDEVKDTMELMGVMELSWTDERLKWDPAMYNDTQSVLVYQERVWRPKVVLTNPSKGVNIPGFVNTLARCFHDGRISWWTGDVFQVRCSADLTSFPFDRQTCGLSFNVWGYTEKEAILVNSMDSMITDYYVRNGIWTLKETSVNSKTYGDLQMLEFVLVIERKATYFLVNAIIPGILLGILSLFVFLVPHECGERISYSITILLSIAVFLSMVSDHLPNNSVKMAAFCYLLLALLLLSSISCFCAIISLQIFHRKPSSPVPRFITILSRRCSPDIKSPTMKDAGGEMCTTNCVDILSLQKEELQMNRGKCTSDKAKLTWQYVSKLFDRVCLVLLTGIFIWSICMYTYNVIEGQK